MNITVKNSTVTIVASNESKGIVIEPRKESLQLENNPGIVDKETAPNGVYIITKEDTLIKPQFYGFYEGKVEVKGVAVVYDGKRMFIHPSQEDLILLEKCELYDAKEFASSKEATEDFNGKDNTEALLKKNSPAAKWVKSLGEEYHLPSLGELKAANKFRDMISAAMLLIGGTPLNGWYWSSSQYSSSYSWVLRWNDGYVTSYYKGYDYYVRAFAAF